jgi:hypothetical protein
LNRRYGIRLPAIYWHTPVLPATLTWSTAAPVSAVNDCMSAVATCAAMRAALPSL